MNDALEIVSLKPILAVTVADAEQRARARAMESFRFSHSLAHVPILTFDSIKQLTRQMLEQKRFDQIFYTTGKQGHGIGMAYSNEQKYQEILETLDALGSEKAWLRLTRVDEAMPELRSVVDQFYEQLSVLYGFDVKARVYRTMVTLFISSPGAVTPYHMDHTWNFLLQITGHKTVHLFDPNDPMVVSQVDRELHYIERPGLKRNHAAGDGIAFELAPGFGVHHPVNAPHWVQNGPHASISLSLGLALHESNRAAKIHQVNHLLRKIGLSPEPPGKNKYRDAMKLKFMEIFSDAEPQSFDDIVFSGWRRLMRFKQGQFH